MAAPTPVIFTDLDATLLDHHDYGWAPAKRALAALAERGVAVCIVTSKTEPEVRALRLVLGNAHPFAVENGGAVCVPEGYFDGAACTPETPCTAVTLGAAYPALRALAVELRAVHAFRYVGFGDMSDAELAAVTGLTPAEAALARRRRASEPLLWQDSDAARRAFAKRVAAAGYTMRDGGRFVHLLGAADKRDALSWLSTRFQAVHGGIRRIALGDSGNDADMLAAADIGYWVARPDGSYYAREQDAIRHARGIGPDGWAAAIDELIANGEI